MHVVTRVSLPSGAPAARKALRPAHAAREDARLRLIWEGECLARLGGRRHVLGCHAVDPAGPALLLEWAPGGTLADALGAGGAPRPAARARAAVVARGLADAIAAVHAGGLVHRDVKPSNVLFAADGSPRLADFGVAAPRGTRGPLGEAWDEAPAGTLGYAAPEQLAGEPAHPAADVYAFAAVLYELATGRPAWTLAPDEDEGALRARILRGAAPALGAPPGALSDALVEVLAGALDPDPARRPATADDLVRRWEAAGAAAAGRR